MVSREDKFMIFSIWKTSLGFIIALSLQLLFFSMMQLENKEENKKNPQYKNVQLLFIQAKDISDITKSVTKRNVFNKKENIDTTLEKNSNINIVVNISLYGFQKYHKLIGLMGKGHRRSIALTQRAMSAK